MPAGYPKSAVVDKLKGVDLTPPPKNAGSLRQLGSARTAFYNRMRSMMKKHPDDKAGLEASWGRFVAFSIAALDRLEGPDGTPLSVQDACAVANIVGKALGKFQDVHVNETTVIEVRGFLTKRFDETPTLPATVDTSASPAPLPLPESEVPEEGVSQVAPPKEGLSESNVGGFVSVVESPERA